VPDRPRYAPAHRIWAAYDAGLRSRGSLAVWFSAAVIEGWRAEARTGRGSQPKSSDLAIAPALTLCAVFRRALRPVEGRMGSLLALLGLELPVPDHSTMSHRAETLEVPRPRGGGAPVPLLVDSTGLRLCGPGDWLEEKHGTQRRRAWRKLHLATAADTGRIVASVPTDQDADDGSRVGPLLDRSDGSVASVTGDGAFDRDEVYAAVVARHPEAAGVVPPRSGAVPSAAAETAPTQRDFLCDASPSAAGWAGRRPRGTAGALWWRPTFRVGSAPSATGCARAPMGGRGPRWRSPRTR
jgi:hypothetical protein